MKKLFLTSSFCKVSDNLLKILPKPPEQMTVVFIPTAADMHEDKWFVDRDMDKLINLGFQIINLSLKDCSVDEVKKTLEKADIIFVGGGNTFYLLEQARKSDATELIPKFVEKGAIYVGSSAGSYLACPTIEAAGWKHGDRNVNGLKDLTALSMVPFIMSVHYSPEYDDTLKESIRSSRFPVKILTDDQALIVSNDSVELVGLGKEIVLA